ncbi:MAG: hypothetical protein IMZ67_00880 [Acidobacteria bacterium]|nr:hypothetical protein [Acidobacteriota bacterium]
MAKREGGMAVRNGFYWNLAKWEMQVIPRQGGILPGGPTDRYVKVPVLALLVVAPVMGGLYAFFLPFIGFAMVAGFAGRKVTSAARSGVSHIAATVSPHWSPGQAYLAGKGKAADAGHPLDAIEREIDEQKKLNE